MILLIYVISLIFTAVFLWIEGKENKTQLEWIPISEKLPEFEEEVLIFTTRGEITVGERINLDGYIEGSTWFIRNGEANAFLSDIKAWMPLPKPYKKGDN